MNTRTSIPVMLMLALLARPSAYALAGQQPVQPSQPSPTPEQPVQPAQAPGSTPGALVPADPASAAIASFYRLQPSDVLEIKYTYTPEYNATVMVRPDGFVTLPIVGEVLVARMTVREVKDAIVTQASQRLRDPELTVEIKDFQKPRFVVGGDVGKPGQFELRGRVTVLEAVAMAGGFKTSAKHSQVLLFRRFDQEKAVTRVVDAKALTRPGSDQEDPMLLPGDFLFVPQNRISKVERFIPIQTIGWLLNIVL